MRIIARLIALFALLLGSAYTVGSARHAEAAAAPTLTVRADGWHVDVHAPGTDTFVFVVISPGMPNRFYDEVRSPFLIDPIPYGGKAVRVSARAGGAPSNPWAPEVPVNVPRAAPKLTVDVDRIHVSAALPNTGSFVFFVGADGMADAYYGYATSPFTIDPWKYGGKRVRVNARAEGPRTNPWGSEILVDVPPPTPGVPVLTVKPDRRHVYATLPGVTRFVFVVKSAGMPDQYVTGAAPLVIDEARYGGRTVRVSARAEGPVSNPWAPETSIDVPAVKLFGIDDAHGEQDASGPDAKRLGITLNRVQFTYGESIESMDAKVDRDARNGLKPLVLLAQYGRISDFDVPGWRRWATAVVARYGPGGAFWQGRTDGEFAPTVFEVLNEPYISGFYPTPEPAAYATFFTQVVTAANAANENARFLLAAWPNRYRDAAGTFSANSWNADLAASPDGPTALALASGITVHPYGSTISSNGWDSAYRAHQDFPALPVWITEVGYRVNDVHDYEPITEEVQAAYLQRALTDFMSWPWAHAFVWFKYQDYGPANMWGTVRTDGTHRPSYHAYRDFIS